MDKTIPVSCACGTIKGSLLVKQGSFFHVHCLCSDCQHFARYLANADNILDAHGGSELFQTYPQYLRFSKGQEHIGCVQLHEKGLFRWYSTCCNMPLANTMTSASVPFVGISVKLMHFADRQAKVQTIGPVLMKAFGKDAIGMMPKDAYEKFPISFMPKILWFMLKGFLLGKSKPSPFFKGKSPFVSAKTLE